ncbi:MAG: serine/threonine-protein kinase [Acidobacteriota bacterium]|nr:serine/threonine-protein kinase [Acidobacteriota bacterium]
MCEACRQDAELHREVSLLLLNHEEDGSVETWAAAAAAQLIDPPVLLQEGQLLGPYRIESFLAAGGMGEVYRATDTRLGRDVAVKVSAAGFSERFEREAAAIASLNHPNICQLYDVGPNYLVMELLEGPTLADRIRQGAIPLGEALGIAHQIAEALEAAHEKGRVHRDLKPANVKLTAEGTVKLLDFGLAMPIAEPLAAGNRTPSVALLNSPSSAGMVVGTAPYMSPEQARGLLVDKRADIWSFGVVLMEMLTGQQVFRGESALETLTSVMQGEPDFERLPDGTPASVRLLLRRCIDKDLRRRLQAIGEARIAIEDTVSAPVVTNSPIRNPRLPWLLLAALLIVSALASTLLYRRGNSQPARVIRFDVAPPNNTSFAESNPAISPDGSRLAFTASSQRGPVLWVRPLDSSTAHQLSGTEGASQPFWSPDNRQIGFFSNRKVKKVDIFGGLPQILCDLPTSPRGGTWNEDNIILFSSGTHPIFRVSAAGGVPEPVTESSVSLLGSPYFLPDGRHFLYILQTHAADMGVYVGKIDYASGADRGLKPGKRLVTTPVKALYSRSPGGETGHLLYMQGGTLMAQPFDPNRFQLGGEPHPIAELGMPGDVGLMLAPFSASSNGVLVYQNPVDAASQFVWFDRAGKNLGTLASVDYLSHPNLAPDGKRVVWNRPDPKLGNWDIWMTDTARDVSSRFTTDLSRNDFPVWSADGKHIFFTSSKDGRGGIFRKLSSGSGTDELVLQSGNLESPTSTSSKYLLYSERDSKTRWRLWALRLEGNASPEPLFRTSFNEMHGQFSSDGKWFAYASDETGRYETYVQKFPPSEGRWQVSNTGGAQPRWRRDGKELFYLSLDGTIMAVELKMGDGFEVGRPKPLFQTQGPSATNLGFTYDVSGDGQRFLINTRSVAGGNSAPIHVVVNWTAALK